MTCLIIEILEFVQILIIAFLQVVPVFKQVDVLKSVVVRIDVIFVSAFPDIEHAVVFAVEVDDGWAPGLPVNIGMHTHMALHNGITHKKRVEVVSGITQRQRLEFCETWLLVREEFMGEPFRTETLVCVNHKSLPRVFSAFASTDTRFTKLINDAVRVFSLEVFKIRGTSPVMIVI